MGLRVFFGVVALIAIVSTAYVVNLYLGHVNITSFTSTQEWGTFGDYVGGLLNPVFGFLGLMALLWTIALQSKELNASREELGLSRFEMARSAKAAEESKNISEKQLTCINATAKKEELLKMISHIDSNLADGLETELTLVNKRGELITQFERIGMGSEARSPKIMDIVGKAKDAHINSALAKRIDPEAVEELEHARLNVKKTSLFIETLIELSQFLKLYDDISEDKTVTDYYRRRYYLAVWDFYEMGYLDVNVVDKFKCLTLELS